MTAQVDPYVRVYYRIVDDPKFAEVFDDDAALALWLRLLLQADAMHPSPAALPHGTKKGPLAKLVRAGLIDLGTGYRYRIHGLSAEREQRSEHARTAARAKHEQPMSSPRAADEHTSRAAISEPNRTEPIQSAPSRLRSTGSLEPVGSILEQTAARMRIQREASNDR